MTTRNFELKKLVRSPEGFESLGRCLLKVFQSQRFHGLICFSELEREIFVYPDVGNEAEQRVLGALLSSDWRENPVEVFPEIFEDLGVPTGPHGFWVRTSFLSSGAGERPAGAYAYVVDEEHANSGPQPDYQSIDPLLHEIVRSRLALKKYREAFHENDYLFTLVSKLGCLLLNPERRHQGLVTLLEIAIHVIRADVGLILTRQGDEFVPTVEMGLPAEVVKGLRFHPDDDSIFECVQRTREPLIIDDISGPSVRVARPHNFRIAGLAAIPLLSESQLVGLVCLAGGDYGQDISTKTLESLETVTAVIGIAIENDRLRQGLPLAADGGASIESALPLSVLSRVLGALDVPAILSTPSGEIRYKNGLAEELFAKFTYSGAPGGEYGTPLDWLRARWREQRELQDASFPFAGSPGRSIRFSVHVLDEGFLTTLREEAPGREALAPGDATREMRDSLARLRLGSDLVLAELEEHSDAVRDTSTVVDRSMCRLAELCDDLEMSSAVFDSAVRRIVSFADLARAAARATRSTLGDEIRIDDSKLAAAGEHGSALVLGNPAQIQRALTRIVVDAGRSTVDQGALVLDLATIDERAVLGMEFESRSPSAITRARGIPAGLKLALRIVSQHSGSVSSASTSPRRQRVEVKLPLAPNTMPGAPR